MTPIFNSVSTDPPAASLPVPLDPAIHRDMRWCANCGGEQVFLAVYEFEAGRMGVCLGCGEEKIVGFTRTTAEGE